MVGHWRGWGPVNAFPTYLLSCPAHISPPPATPTPGNPSAATPPAPGYADSGKAAEHLCTPEQQLHAEAARNLLQGEVKGQHFSLLVTLCNADSPGDGETAFEPATCHTHH